MLQVATPNPGLGAIELPRSPAPLVKADELVFIHFERPDLDRAERYLRDFGLIVASRNSDSLFLRGTGTLPFFYRLTRGPHPRFRGLGVSVPAQEDLEKLSKAFGRPVEKSDAPGGGSVVRLHDPEGVAVDVCTALRAANPCRCGR